MKILLINPPTENTLNVGIDSELMDIAGVFPPIGLLYIATVLKKYNYEPVIIDCPSEKISHKKLIELITAFSPDVVGITTFTTTMTDVLLCAKNIKEINKSTVTVLGGHHIYSYPELSIEYDNIDFILQGEADLTFFQLIEAIQRKDTLEEIAKIDGVGFKRKDLRVLNKSIAYIKDLDELPIPDRTLLPKINYSNVFDTKEPEINIISSRGCPFNCSFCFTPEKKYRSRSAENIMTEIKQLFGEGYRNIFFFDDLFSLSEKKIIDISERIINEKLDIAWSFRGRISSLTEKSIIIAKKSGLKRIQLGIESMNNDVLKSCGKHIIDTDILAAIAICKKHKITVVGNFMIGLPGQTWEVMTKDIKMSRNIGLDFVEYNLLGLLPNTRLYIEAIEDKIIPFDFWEKYAKDPLSEAKNFRMYLYTKYLTEAQQFKLCRQAFKRFYLRPKFILRRLSEIKDFKTLKNHIFGALKVLKFNPSKR